MPAPPGCLAAAGALPAPKRATQLGAAPAPQVVLQALLCPEAVNKSFDLVARPEGKGEPMSSWDVLFDQTTAGL